MTYLSYDGLRRAIEDPGLAPSERLQVEPYDPHRLRSASLELHLGSTVARWRQRGQMLVSLAPRALTDISERDFEITRGLGPGDRFVVSPGEAVLVSVDCWIGLGAGLIARVEGKSTIGRSGQIIHTAGFVEPGFVGVLTLEPVNLSPVPVVYEVGMPIAQLTVARLDQPTSRPYGHPELGSRYQGQHEVTPPRPHPSGALWGADVLRRGPGAP
jgi:dCTP deaminase